MVARKTKQGMSNPQPHLALPLHKHTQQRHSEETRRRSSVSPSRVPARTSDTPCRSAVAETLDALASLPPLLAALLLPCAFSCWR
jgi:hypothetical protein